MRKTQQIEMDGAVVEFHVREGSAAAVVVCHGGHMSAAVELGENVFETLGFTVITPSRPGYGATSLAARESGPPFVDRVVRLVEQLGCSSIAAVVGISAGGPVALELAARHPGFVERVIVQNAVSTRQWPDRWTRMAGRVVFAPGVERATWAMVRALLRVAPTTGLVGLMASLSTRSSREVVASLGPDDRDALIRLFVSMRSGRGFRRDLASRLSAEVVAAVSQPALVMSSEFDASVGPEHAADLSDRLTDATPWVGGGPSHLMWFGAGAHDVDVAIRSFMSDVSAEHRDESGES